MGGAYERLLDALAANGSNVRSRGQRAASAQCPAHEDHAPSLSITGIEGQALLFCHAGCHTDDVLAALNLTKADLFDNPKGAVYRYDNGRTKFRTPDKRFWQKGTENPPELFHLAKVKSAIADGRVVYVVEGEKDVLAMESLGAVATCNPQGAGRWSEIDPTPLHGGIVIIVADQDDPGRKHAANVASSLQGHADWFVVAPAEGKDAADHIAAGHGLDEFRAAEQPVIEDPGNLARQMFPRLDWHELWADDSAEEWLHIPLLAARRSVVVYSPPKAGKSLLVLEFAVALTRGEEFLGHQIERRVRVLYVDFENDPRGDVRSRLQAMGYGPDDLDHLDYLSFPSMAGLDSERGSIELLEAVHAYGAEVVIIDTVSRAVDGEENSNDTWLGLYRHTGLKLKQAGVAMVRLDHTGKDETKGQRGGSAKSGDVDAVWRLTKITDERYRLECTDSRMVIETKSLHLIRHRYPRLHHTAEILGATTDREARIEHIVHLLDSNGIPVDASRETIREYAASRGVKARNDVFADVARRRKESLSPLSPAVPPTSGTAPQVYKNGGMSVPEAGDSLLQQAPLNGQTPMGTVGTAQNGTVSSEHETPSETVPKVPGTAGDNGDGPIVPGAAVRSTAPWGQRDSETYGGWIAGKRVTIEKSSGRILGEPA